jgi:hypothetical protein
MNHKHNQTLQALFAHPTSGNIDAQRVLSMIQALDGEVTHGGHGQIVIRLAGHTQGFHEFHHTLSKEQVMDMRKFLETAGVAASRQFSE